MCLTKEKRNTVCIFSFQNLQLANSYISLILSPFFLALFHKFTRYFCIQFLVFFMSDSLGKRNKTRLIHKTTYSWLHKRAWKSGKRDTPKILKLRPIRVMRVNASRRTSHYQWSLSEEEIIPEEEGEKRCKQRARMNSSEMRNR